MEQTERQRTEEKIQWLSRYRKALRRQQILDMDLEQARGMVLCHASPMDGMPRASGHSDKTGRAAERLMRTRGNDATGWGIAWKVNVWARLKNGEEAKDCLDKAMRLVETPAFSYGGGGGLYANLLDAHPPFQIDGNFGIAAGIAEMLVQNGPDGPELLPAVPAAWKSGSVRGLRVKGGQSVSFSWQDGRVTQTERT